ncbi:hypothetical protein [Desulfitobacterium metallireducens]|uniref:hypothetical protein n=1 Tax=Desulfitobacterium metallireducens TaxID=142877 RepID=UPI001FA7C3E5|nr:hypothetical protein [Desulfitobacterium metallireducens]
MEVAANKLETTFDNRPLHFEHTVGYLPLSFNRRVLNIQFLSVYSQCFSFSNSVMLVLKDFRKAFEPDEIENYYK